ncbi:MAG: tetratricopeptide repeat protein [Bryobacteraceae bacterium]
MARGDLDEALRIRLEDELPVYEKLGDVRERAVTLGKIADIRMARGDLDEALRIRLEDELPVYEKLGDVRERAVTLGKIADIRMARGDLDEALRILTNELLPAFEKLGDAVAGSDAGPDRRHPDGARGPGRGAAHPPGRGTPGHEAGRRAVAGGDAGPDRRHPDGARGDLDEALRIRLDEELPVYEKLGDVWERAVTLGKIADIRMARGDLGRGAAHPHERVASRFREAGRRAVAGGDAGPDRRHPDGARGPGRGAAHPPGRGTPGLREAGRRAERAVTLGKIADIRMARGTWTRRCASSPRK